MVAVFTVRPTCQHICKSDCSLLIIRIHDFDPLLHQARSARLVRGRKVYERGRGFVDQKPGGSFC